MRELKTSEVDEVNGGGLPFIVGWAVGHVMSKATDSYIEWVQNGAGGWTEEYDPNGYADPLL